VSERDTERTTSNLTLREAIFRYVLEPWSKSVFSDCECGRKFTENDARMALLNIVDRTTESLRHQLESDDEESKVFLLDEKERLEMELREVEVKLKESE
jgi:hypothetical protein